MRYRNRRATVEEELNVWPSFTDLMSNAVMILLLLLLFILLKPYLKGAGDDGPAPNEAPPFLVIPDAGSYRFSSGSAEIPSTLDRKIRQDFITKIEENVKKYKINLIEVIGHTDGQPNGTVRSNLDQELSKVANGQQQLSRLYPGSNADLGLMRALAVVKLFKNLQQDQGRLPGVKFRAYSSAQLTLPNGEFAPNDPAPNSERRRIEIRFTRLGAEKKLN